MMKRWLVLDIGNTHTVAGVYELDLQVALVRFRTDASLTSDEYRVKLGHLLNSHWNRIERVIVSSVVPPLERVVRQALAPLPCLMINSDTRRDFHLDLPIPSQLGADRLANVAGALTLAKSPFLIVDAGTATTFCLVDSRPSYIGGAIVPGIETGWKALQARAARLFSVELVHPGNSIGRTTETQLQSGVLIGYESMIEGMVDRLLSEAPPEFRTASLFATGGCIHLLKLSKRFRFEPDLTLLGLLQYGKLTE